ncbi:MAG: hypothetical protein K0S11_459 [Gammaproteobacteria bacterium]|jgi:uncharacterized protein YjeT (DUF2065 family)|nr:hypothetical protein [Gammaproteobacteria bacterium]
MLADFLAAFALVLVIEGILPFLCPDCWRTTMQKLLEQQPHTLRMIGLLSMLLGIILLYVIH